MSQRKIIWLGIVTSTFIYAAIIWSMARTWPDPGPFAEALGKPMVPGLYIAAVVMFIAALTFPRMISDHRPRFIMRLALFEACTIFGLLAAFLTRDWHLYIAPWVLSLIGFMSNYPSDVE